MKWYEIAVQHNQAVGMEPPIYSSDEDLEPGQIVTLTYRGRSGYGLVLQEAEKPTFKTNTLEETPFKLPKDLLATIIWQSQYYHININRLVRQILPKGLGKKRRKSKQDAEKKVKSEPQALTKQQEMALKRIENTKKPVLLHGDTGSGKTEIYLKRTQNVLNSNRSALILIPEIGLSSQVAQEFKKRFKNVIELHSQVTESAKDGAWQTLMNTTEPFVVVGARSALFAPIKNLGLIVIDEFHDDSFKQETWPQYDAVLTAMVRTQSCTDAQLLLGSATPDVAMYARFEERNYPIVRMEGLARGSKDALQANTTVVDMTEHSNHASTSMNWLSKQLKNALKQAMSNGEQTMVFLGRRGSAPLLLCENCSWQSNCINCDLPMTLHMDIVKSVCHTCNTSQAVPTSCPDCAKPSIISKGVGTKQIESDLKSLFPTAKIARFDSDNLQSEQLHRHISDLKEGSIDIVIGTQIITKGLDLPKLTTLGIIHAEGGLQLPDYSAAERVYQTLHQVLGRVGRHSAQNTAILQTFTPELNLITYAKEGRWDLFYKDERLERTKQGYPPDSFLLTIKGRFASAKTAEQKLNSIVVPLKEQLPEIEVLGPAPAFRERLGTSYNWQLLIKSKKRSDLLKIANALEGSSLTYVLDPSSLL